MKNVTRLRYHGGMNPFLASVSYPQGWWNNVDVRASMFQAFQSPEWVAGLLGADTPSGTVLKEVLINTSESHASLEDMALRRSLVAALTKVGVDLPSRHVSGQQFKYDGLLTGLVETARELGPAVWEETSLLNTLLVACRFSSVTDLRHVGEWLKASGRSYRSPMLGATVAEVICVLGLGGRYNWIGGSKDLETSKKMILDLYRTWKLNESSDANLMALWSLMAHKADNSLNFAASDVELENELFDRRQFLMSYIGTKGVVNLCDHPSPFIRLNALNRISKLLGELSLKGEGESAENQWIDAWRVVASSRIFSGVSKFSSELLAVVEKVHGPCPVELEKSLPIELLQHGYARRLVQLTGNDRLSQWLDHFKALSQKPGAHPYRVVLEHSLSTTEIWPNSWDHSGWSMLQMESRLTIPEPSSGKPKVRM